MATALLTHPDALGHDMGPGHPERPDRVQALMALFAEAGIAVDAAYVLNLVNGIVALLNAQPGDALGPLAVKAA